ncbi:MAG: PLP-dependent transferase, partial [Patescibacteria group bacterium]
MPSVSPELVLPEPAPARYATEEELTASLRRKATPQPLGGLYPRDGTEEVTAVEEAISQITIPDQRLNVVVSSGMAAVIGSVDFALDLKGQEKKNPKVAYPNALYTQSTGRFHRLKNMGVITTPFDAGDSESVDRAIDERKADVVFAETVSNTPPMAVLDVHHLLEKIRVAGEDAPIVILDNTLQLSTGIDFDKLLKPDDRVLIVESATKSALHNSGHLGVVYGKNEELMDQFRRFKAAEGIVTSTEADPIIISKLEATIPGFHERNLALYESTGIIAVALAEATQEMDNVEFTVEFPTFPEHANHEYVEANLPNGVSPVVFMTTPFMGGAPRDLIRRLSKHPRMREQICEGQIFLGQSFGFKEATLLYDPD